MERFIGTLSSEIAQIEYAIESSGVPPHTIGLVLMGLFVWFLIGRTAVALLRRA